MPSKAEYNPCANELVADNQVFDLWAIHDLLHEGKFEAAQRWANRIGLNLPPGQSPKFGFPLSDEIRGLLRQTLEGHKPTESGLPDHTY